MIVPRYICGLDLGQANDFSALAVVKYTPAWDGEDEWGGRSAPTPPRYDVVHLERYELGTPYPAIVGHVAGLVVRRELRPWHQPEPDPGTVSVRAVQSPRVALALDATGVGRVVVDMFIQADMEAEVHCVTITAGHEARRDHWPGAAASWYAPKRDLIGVLQAGLQGGTLRIVPGLALADVLQRELLGYRVRVTAAAHEVFGTGRDAPNDDLVLAVALACWTAGRPDDRLQVVPNIFQGLRGYGPGPPRERPYGGRRRTGWRGW
jgi:hypothetical protein